MARVSYAAGLNRPVTSGRRARRTKAATSGRVARWTWSWWRCSITPRPSSRPRSSSRAASTAAFSESVACCSSRTLSGRCEAKRIASSAAARSLTGSGSRLDLDGSEPLRLPDFDAAPAEQLEQGYEGDDRFQPVLRLQDQLHHVDRTLAETAFDQLQLLLQGPGPAHDAARPRRDAG